MNITITCLVPLAAVLMATACGGDDGSTAEGPAEGPAGGSSSAASSAALVPAGIVACLVDAGLDAEEVESGDTARIEVRYPLDTTKLDFRDTPADAEQDLEFGEAYDFNDFIVGSVYVLLGDDDESAVEDRPIIEGCLS
ncbi:MAG: hypothetical protein JWN84_4487 [Nocardioides sp.]|nr:hypothetical protein [Nocardioides sp.]